MPKLPRRAAFVALAVVLLAACGRSPDEETAAPSDTGVASSTPVASAPVESTQAAEPTTTIAKPAVEIPAAIPTELVVTDIEEGSGLAAVDGDTVVVRYVGVRTEDGTEFDTNFDGGQPFPVTLGAGGVIAGWDQGLVGIKQGGRRQLDIPADLAYGDQPQGEIIQPGDALSFVVDALVVIPVTDPADAPAVPIEGKENVDEVVIEDQVVGEGEELQVGQTAVVHLVAMRADTGEVLFSSWDDGQPQSIPYGDDLIGGLFEGLQGMKAGGRRVVTIPHADLDPQFSEQLGLPADVDLVLILDLIAVY